MKTRSVLVALLFGAGIPVFANPTFAAPFFPVSPAVPVVAPDNTAREKVAELRRTAIEKRLSGDFEGAAAACRAALFIAAKSPEIYAELAEIAAAKGEGAEACKNYRLSVGLEPGQTWGTDRMEDGDLQLRFALYLLKTANYTDAVALYKEALDKMPDDEKKVLPGKMDTKALPNDPAERQKFETTLRLALGLRHIALGATDEAAVQFAETLKLAPEHPAVQYGLGTVHLAKGRKEEARVALLKAADGRDGTVRGWAKKALETDK
jgi:tetratricopeptide (TPR) repeat protein